MSLRDAVRLNHGLRAVIDQLTFDGANQDVVLSRGAANRLDLASGDSFRIVSGSLLMNATDLNETDLAKIDGITNGTGAANKALVLDANADITAGLRALTLTSTIDLPATTSSTTGVITKGSTRFMHNFSHPTGGGAVPAGQNFFAGLLAGNFSLGSTATDTAEGSYNTGVGYNTLAALTTGYQNTAVGNVAGSLITTGQGNTLLGYGAGTALTTGGLNVLVGVLAGRALTTASYNVALGTDTLKTATTAAQNIAIGYDSLHDTTTGGSNIAIGYQAMRANTVGDENTAIGTGAGYGTSAGGVSNTTGTYNVWIGSEAGPTAAGLTNTIAIGKQARVDASNTTVIGNSSTTTTKIYGTMNFGPAGGATTSVYHQKKVTAIADNTATTVFTVTIPNANHAAAVRLMFLSSNGSTDAFESSRAASGMVVVARTTGANAVVTAATIDDAAIATVSGGATHTLAYSVSAISGAADASNTFTIQVTIDDSGNVGSNQVVAIAELLNAEATGVTIS